MNSCLTTASNKNMSADVYDDFDEYDLYEAEHADELELLDELEGRLTRLELAYVIFFQSRQSNYVKII